MTIEPKLSDPLAFQWALPEKLDVPPDALKVRLDFYKQSAVMYVLEDGAVTTKMVSPQDVALSLLRDIPLGSGLLPENTLWWQPLHDSPPAIALWQPPRVWRVALQLEAFKQPRRFSIPMPGLIFICRSASPPRIVAVKKRPLSPEEPVYRAPLFNVYRDGHSCPGSHKYSNDISKIPEEFFTAFFTKTQLAGEVSRKHGSDVLKLWEELDGKKSYPLRDLMPMGKVADLIK